MEYFTRTKAGGIHPLHPNEVLTYLRRGHQSVYAARALPPRKGGEPGFSWISCWVDPQAQEAVVVRLAALGFATWQLCIAALRVRWNPYRVTRSGDIKRVQTEPRERIITQPITPGRIWVRVPIHEVQKFIVEHRNAYAEGFRVELDVQGNVPVVDFPRLPREQKFGPVLSPGDIVWVPSKKIWGRMWNYLEDKHFVELGDMVCPRPPIDAKIRDRHRVAIVPVTACVMVDIQETSSSESPEAPTQIAQKRGHGGGRKWSTGRVMSM